MSSKKMMMLGLFVGSIVGGYIPTLLGAGMFSFSSLFASGIGGIIGIWLAKKSPIKFVEKNNFGIRIPDTNMSMGSL